MVEVDSVVLGRVLGEVEAGLRLQLLNPWHLAGGRQTCGEWRHVRLGEVPEFSPTGARCMMQSMGARLALPGSRCVPVTALLECEGIGSVRPPLDCLNIQSLS